MVCNLEELGLVQGSISLDVGSKFLGQILAGNCFICDNRFAWLPYGKQYLDLDEGSSDYLWLWVVKCRDDIYNSVNFKGAFSKI